MSSPTVAPSLAGNILGSAAGNFVIAEWQDAGGVSAQPRFIAPLHLHHSDDEAWYVLEGVLRVKVGNDDVEVRAGSGVLVPCGTPHTYWNPGPDRVRYLLIMTPNFSGRKSRGCPVLLAFFARSGAFLWPPSKLLP